MEQTIVNFILGRLSALSNDELINLDFESALAIMNDGLSDSEKQQLKRIFTSIQSELGVRHYGVKGMRWGVRRYQNKDGSLTEAGKRRAAEANAKSSIFGTAQKYSIQTRSGESISVEPLPPPSTARKIWDALMGTGNVDMGTRGDANYVLNDSSGNKIGELSLISKSAKVAYVDWITVDEKQRGKGYATDVLNDLIGKARESGYSKVELNALKKARPLYERLGFTYQDRSKVNIITRISEWELGTKRMEYYLMNEINHMESTIYTYTVGGQEFELQHHGVKGMRWGVRRAQKRVTKYRKKAAQYDRYSKEYAKEGSRRYGSDGARQTDGEIAWMRQLAADNKAKSQKYKAKADKLESKINATKESKKLTRESAAKIVAKGAEKTARVLSKVGQAYITDQLFFGGMGTKMVKETVKAMGMASITAFTMARGGYDIKWYDKAGNRVG